MPDEASSGAKNESPDTASSEPASQPICTCTEDVAKCMKHASTTKQDKAKECIPDGGYGWVVVLASFMLQCISIGMALSVGIYHVAFLEAFNETNGLTAWISSINTGLLLGAGPVSSILTNRFGHRKIVIVGGILTTAGMFISAFATDIYFLFFSYGVITGFGFNFILLPSVVIVAVYFDKRQGLAMGVAGSGAGLGGLVFAPLFQLLINIWGWRGALILSAGISGQACVFGSFLRPIEEHVPRLKPFPRESGFQISKLIEITLLVDCTFITLLINIMLWNIGSFILYVVIPDYAQHHGIKKDDSIYLLFTISIFNFVGRLLVAVLTTHKRFHSLFVFELSTLVSGIAIVLVSTSHEYPVLMTYCGIYGLFYGMKLGVLAFMTVELFGVNKITSAFGYFMFGSGAGALIGPPLAGWLIDITRGYEISFYVGGSVTLLAAGILVVIPVLKYIERKRVVRPESVIQT